MQKLLCPSMMCADFGNLREEILILEEAGADMLHVDIMDGSFVPNFAMGRQDLEYIKSVAKIPVDAHLMIENPDRHVETFAKLGTDIIYIHPETDRHSPRTLKKIADLGSKPGICINPGTAAETVAPLLSLAEYVLVMTVNPGFAGQQFLPFVTEKIELLVRWKQRYGYRILIDGACSPEKIKTLSEAGVDGFILGTAALFGKPVPYSEIIAGLRTL